MNIVIIGGSRIVLIGSTSGIRRDRGGTFTETRKKSSEEDRSLLETSDLGKVTALWGNSADNGYRTFRTV